MHTELIATLINVVVVVELHPPAFCGLECMWTREYAEVAKIFSPLSRR